MKNLEIAFPDKTRLQKIRIAKDFYHGLVDTFMETLKFFSWNYKDIEKRFTANMTGMEEAYKTGRPVHAIGMHNFNWEYVNWWISKNNPIPFLGIYMPIGNKIFDRMLINLRSKYGTVLIPATNFKEHYIPYTNRPHILGSVADQSPGNPLNAYWLDFFGRRTAFVKGAEAGAVYNHATVVFVHFYKVKRGYYHADTKFYVADAATLDKGEMTKTYAAFVEASVRRMPANYLWSHRRWKHEWKPEYSDLTID